MDEEIINEAPLIRLKRKQNNFSLKKNEGGILNRLSDILKKESNEDDNSNNLYLSNDRNINKIYNIDISINYIDQISNDKKNRYETLEPIDPYYNRINTQVEKLNNKLYNNPKKTDNLLKIDKSNYYYPVLSKQNINNLRSLLNFKNYQNTSYVNKSLNNSRKKIIIKNLDDLDVKELQKLYYDIDDINLPKIKKDSSNKNETEEKRSKYIYENYASNKNIFNHPKVYILEKNDKKLPQIKNKSNEKSLKLEYDKKKIDKLKFYELYFNFSNKKKK